MDSLLVEIFDEIVALIRDISEEDKICLNTKFSALKPTQLFTLKIDPVRAIQTPAH